MEGHFTWIDWAVLILYFVAVMVTGLYFWRKSRSVEGFTAANRSLPGWVVGFSILATYVSSISFLANPGKSFDTNWNPFVFSLSLPIGTWIAVRYFLPYYRRSNEVSAYSHLEHRFGPWARMYVGCCYLLIQLARMGAVMYLLALPLKAVLQWETWLIIVVTGICVTAYTFVGGIVAVIWTDAIQCIILMVGALICLILMLFDLDGGPAELFKVGAENDKWGLGSFGFNLDEPTFWVVLFYGIVINLTNFGIDQNYVQRYIAAKSDSDARKSLWLGGLSFVPLSALFFLIGTVLYVYYTKHALPEGIRDRPDEVFPYFIVTALPPGLTGLLLAAVFAAAMSTVSTSLNSSATLMLTDFYQRYFRPDASERQQMRCLYVSTIVWGILGTLLALTLDAIGNRSVLDTWWVLAGVFSGGMVGIFLLGMISRAGNPAAVTATCLGVVVILWMSVPPLWEKIAKIGDFDPKWSPSLEPFRSSFHSLLIPVFGTLTIMLVGIVLTKVLSRAPVEDQ